MGIHGIYQEIGPGDRIALSKLAVDKFEETGRPLRIAIDTSIWLFQIQASKGGTNPALRTFYYRLLRLLSLSIHPLFVFDGPNKPPFKRNKRTGPNVASIPEFLAKQLLKQFGFPFHIAPGEAEAECALLQREGIVDAVLSEDVDTLMFGSRVSLRNWSAETKSGKVPTHVNLYDSEKTKSGSSGLDREGMILVALMSGGDYSPEGIPGCGPKTACEAARAGFGARLCAIAKRDTTAIQEWRENLSHELKTNESKFFKRKHKALAIPEEFPRADILGYYTNPAISSKDALERLKRNLRWDQDLNFPELRTFTEDAFEWVKVTGAKKFIRNLAPALLVRHLRMRGQGSTPGLLGNPGVAGTEEAKLVASIHGRRQHPSTDNTPELRVAFTPHSIVNIDLDAEEPDDEPEEDEDEDEEDIAIAGDGDGDGEAPKKRGPYLYDPTKLDKIWLFESFVKIGAPLAMQDWEETQRKKAAPKPAKVTKPRATKKATGTGGMQKGALDRFARISKAGAGPPPSKHRSPIVDRLDLSGPKQGGVQEEPSDAVLAPSDRRTRKPSKAPKSPPRATKEPVYIDILSSSPVAPYKESESNPNTLDEHYLSPNVTKRARHSRRLQPSPGGCTDSLPSQPAVTADTFQTSPIGRHQSRSSAARPIRESEPLLQGLPQTQKTTSTRAGVSRARRPSTPPRGGPRGKTSALVSPSKRQMTLEESFRVSQGGTPSRIRHENFLAAPKHDTPAMMASVEEVEELDLSHLSPRAGSGETFQSLGDSRTRTFSQLSRPTGKASGDATCGASKRLEDRALRGTTGNKAGPEAAKAMSRSEKVSLAAEPKPASLEKSAELRRSPRQHRTMPSPEASRVDERLGKPTKAVRKKQVIKLRESLVGSWKLVDASSVEVMERKGDGSRQEGRSGKRKAWRQSEVEVLDLTSD